MADEQLPKRYTAEEIHRARDLRIEGRTYTEIGAEIGMSKERLHRYLKDLPKPERKTAAELDPLSPTQYQAMVDGERREDRRRNALTADDGDSNETAKALVMPSIGRYPIEGDRPSYGLVKHSVTLLRSWRDQKAVGRIFLRRPIAVTQALVVLLHSYQPTDMDWLLASRSQWKSIRELAGLSLKDMGQRVNTSSSTVRRWENNTRTPGASEAALIQLALAAAQEEALVNNELALAFDSAFEKIATDEGIDISEVEANPDQPLKWITNPIDNEGTIEHLRHLATVRSLMPHPTWRQPDPGNFYLKGYAASRAHADAKL